MKRGIAKNDAQKSESRTRRAKCEIQFLRSAAGEPQQSQQHPGDNRIDRQQNDPADGPVSVQGKSRGMRHSRLDGGDHQKKHGMNQRNDGALAIVD